MVHIMGTIMSPMPLPLLFRAGHLVIFSFPVFVINRFTRNAVDPSVVFTDYIIFYPRNMLFNVECLSIIFFVIITFKCNR